MTQHQTTISIAADSQGTLISRELLNAIRALLRADGRHAALLSRLDRNTARNEAGGITILLGQDRALAVDLSAAIGSQLPERGAKVSPLQRKLLDCATVLRQYRPPVSAPESAIHAWECPCGERNSPALAACRACRGTIANGRIVPAIAADAATVVRRGPSALRPPERIAPVQPASPREWFPTASACSPRGAALVLSPHTNRRNPLLSSGSGRQCVAAVLVLPSLSSDSSVSPDCRGACREYQATAAALPVTYDSESTRSLCF